MKLPLFPRCVLPAGVAAGLLIAGAGSAQAHLVSTGFGPFYDGMGHLVLSPEYWIPVVALALYAGLCGRQPSRRALLFHPAGWLVGGLGSEFFRWQPSESLIALLILFFGLLVAVDLRMKSRSLAFLAALLGLVLGWLHGTAMQLGGGTSLALIGAAVPVFLAVAILEGLVVSLEQPWTRIGVRVMGSWIAATGVLLLGWSLHHVKS